MNMIAKCTIIFDGKPLTGEHDEPLVDFLVGHGIDLPHICYHRSLGPLQTCDVCWVEVDGELQRGCAIKAREGLIISSKTQRAEAAQHEGMDRLLAKHELYCTLCENNTGDCTLHNTVADMNIPIPPLPKHNFRYGQRTPVDGVPVEVKWAQNDYVLPPEQQSNPEKL